MSQLNIDEPVSPIREEEEEQAVDLSENGIVKVLLGVICETE